MGRLIISKQLEKASGQYYLIQSDVNGDLQFATAASVVTGNETTTSVTDNRDGTFDFNDEAGGTTVVSIPYAVSMTGTANAATDSIATTAFVVPNFLNGKTIARFNAYFEDGTGTHTVTLKKNGTNVVSVTSLTATNKGTVVDGVSTVATGDILTTEFTTSVTGYAVAHGTASLI